MITKKLNATIGAYDPYTRSVEITASTTNVVMGVALKSWDLTRFQKNPVILWAHEATKLPVGLARDVTFSDDGLRMRVYFGSAKANPCAEQLSHCVAEGLVRAVSVGYTEEEGTNILDEVSFVSIGMDEDAGTPHIALDHPANEGVVKRKRAITPYGFGFENATAKAAAAQATNRPAPPLPLASLAISVVPPKDKKPEVLGDDLARFIDSAEKREMEGDADEEMMRTRDLNGEDEEDECEDDEDDDEVCDDEETDEDREERLHRCFRDAARTLRLHYARTMRAKSEGACVLDCLEMFDRGMATIRVESPKGDDRFDAMWTSLFNEGDAMTTERFDAKAHVVQETKPDGSVKLHEFASKKEATLHGMAMRTTNPQVYVHEAGSKWIDSKATKATAGETHATLAAAHAATAAAISAKGPSSVNYAAEEKAKHTALAEKHGTLARAYAGDDAEKAKPAAAPAPAAKLAPATGDKLSKAMAANAKESFTGKNPFDGSPSKYPDVSKMSKEEIAANLARYKDNSPGPLPPARPGSNTGNPPSKAQVAANAVQASVPKPSPSILGRLENLAHSLGIPTREASSGDFKGVSGGSSGGGGHGGGGVGQSRDDHGRWDGINGLDLEQNLEDGNLDGIAPETKAAKKASADNVKALDKQAELASMRAGRSNAPEDHKAAALANRAAAKAEEQHYYGFRNSRNTNEQLHQAKQTHLAIASTHEAGNTPPHIAEAIKRNPAGGDSDRFGNKATKGDTTNAEREKIAQKATKAAREATTKASAIGEHITDVGSSFRHGQAANAHAEAAKVWGKVEGPGADAMISAHTKQADVHRASAGPKSGASEKSSGASGATKGADAIHAAASKEAASNGGGHGGGGVGQSRDDHGRWDAADCDHFDSGKLGKVDRTQLGGARVPARLSRTGVLTYRNPDGTVRRELRLASEIFKADSLKTLEHAPVIDIKHHTGMVTPATFREVSLGHVTGVRQEGKFIVGDLLVQDQHTLDGIDNEERTEVSLGYRCVLDMTPGVYEGEPYDCVQRSIRYNHAALCPPGRGRAGSEVGLRLDSNDSHATAPSFWWSNPMSEDTEGDTVMTVKVRIDGRDFDFGSEAHIAKLDEVVKNARLDAKDAIEKLSTETKRADIAEGERDSLKATVAKITLDAAEAADKDAADKPAFDEMQKERRRHRRKMERIALRFFGDTSEGDDKNAPAPAAAAGTPVAGNAAGADKNAPAVPPGTPGQKQQKRDFPPGAKAPPFTSKDGGAGKGGPPSGDEEKTDALEERIDAMSDRDLLVFCISKHVENFDATGKSDDYLQARFDGIVETVRAGRGIAGVVAAARLGVQNLDAQEDDEVSKARRARDKVAAEAWKPKTA